MVITEEQHEISAAVRAAVVVRAVLPYSLSPPVALRAAGPVFPAMKSRPLRLNPQSPAERAATRAPRIHLRKAFSNQETCTREADTPSGQRIGPGRTGTESLPRRWSRLAWAGRFSLSTLPAA